MEIYSRYTCWALLSHEVPDLPDDPIFSTTYIVQSTATPAPRLRCRNTSTFAHIEVFAQFILRLPQLFYFMDHPIKDCIPGQMTTQLWNWFTSLGNQIENPKSHKQNPIAFSNFNLWTSKHCWILQSVLLFCPRLAATPLFVVRNVTPLTGTHKMLLGGGPGSQLPWCSIWKLFGSLEASPFRFDLFVEKGLPCFSVRGICLLTTCNGQDWPKILSCLRQNSHWHPHPIPQYSKPASYSGREGRKFRMQAIISKNN